MVNFYVIQIRLGKITIEDVPDKFRDAVEEAQSEKQ